MLSRIRAKAPCDLKLYYTMNHGLNGFFVVVSHVDHSHVKKASENCGLIRKAHELGFTESWVSSWAEKMDA